MNKAAFRILLLCCCCLGPGVYAGQAQIQGVKLYAVEGGERVVFSLNKKVRYKLFVLSDPERVVIDFLDARLKASTRKLNYRDSTLARIRSAPRRRYDLRVVLDLQAKHVPKSQWLPDPGGRGYQLHIDLKPAAAAPARPRVVKAPLTPEAPAQPHPKNRPLSKPRPAKPALRDVIVAVDAGHGGSDPGAQGPRGTKEKDITLAMARKLAGLINKEPGMRAVMIRDGDYRVRLRTRIERARKHKADLLVSIHADAFRDPRAHGSSVYVLSRKGASSEAARWLAASENASDLIGVDMDGTDDEVLREVIFDLYQDATVQDSIYAGGKVLKHLRAVSRLHRPGVEHAPFAVLKAPDVPSILVETAFISNPEEEARLRSGAGQQRMARAIFQGIRDYFHDNPPRGTKLAAMNQERRHVIARGDTLSKIAGRYGVSVATLRAANGLRSDRLFVGNVLRIPLLDGG